MNSGIGDQTRGAAIYVKSVPVGAVLFLALAGCSADKPVPSPPTRSTNDRGVFVQVAEAKAMTLSPKLELVGVVVAVPERTAVVSPQQGGWVNKLDVVEGQSVRAGDVLVELDSRSAAIAVQRAKAVVAEKEATLVQLKRGYLPEEIAAARQDAEKAAATVDGLKNELDALKDLLDRKEVSPVVYETKAKSLESARAALASARERVKLLESGTRPETIAAAQALLDAAKADLEQAGLALQWCTITSPIDGLVVQLSARKGQYFDRAAPLATVIDLSEVFVQLRVPSSDFGKVGLGTQIDARFDPLPGRTYHGQVARITGQADPLTGNVVVFSLIKNNDHLLRPGLNCKVQVALPEIADALAVPTAAVADNSGTPVVTVIRNGKAHETKVETGAKTRDFVQILKGLSEGDLVATVGGYGLPDGCPVTIVRKTVAGNTAD